MKIDLHCHTIYSGDSRITPRELIARARLLGMDGVCVTEHQSFEASAPVEKIAREEGFPVFRGVEVSTDKGHIVLFGVPDDSWNVWGSRHYCPAFGVIERAIELGALVIAAHPYGRRDLHAAMDDIFSMKGVEAIETANGRSREGEDELSEKAARIMGLPRTGGSDCHGLDEVAGCYTVFENPINSLEKLIAEIRAGRCAPVRRSKPIALKPADRP